MTYEFHPLADVLPLIEGAEFDRLVADIAEHGLLNPIVLRAGQILDGRNRDRACRAAGVQPRYVEFDGKDPAAFVLSQNLARRHLGPSERAMVAARMANLKWGQRADRVEGSIDLSTAAKLANVSEPSVKRARVVLERGTLELQQAVEHGRIAVHEAARATAGSSSSRTGSGTSSRAARRHGRGSTRPRRPRA
jgi:ParB-like chromosome segregation protein Spo0J